MISISQGFSFNGLWRDIGYLILAPTFGIGGQDYGRRERNKIQVERKERSISFG